MDKIELSNLKASSSAEEIFNDFILEQTTNWPLAATNFNGLKSVAEREITFENCTIKVQFNPERIRSSAAKVDTKSIQERRCFLCLNHLPEQQRGIFLENGYVILINPFPIIPHHFTIPKTDHVDQSFINNLRDMLQITAAMENYTLFYNGPKCGASAPDHMHFQGGTKNFMPVEKEYLQIKSSGEIIFRDGTTEVVALSNYMRKMIVIESYSQDEIIEITEKIYAKFSSLQPEESEAMLNVISGFNNKDKKHTLYIFPRRSHRPSQYFEEGDKQILISPASVDFGGVFITPRESDFNKLSKSDIEDIFKQVTVDDDMFSEICSAIN